MRKKPGAGLVVGQGTGSCKMSEVHEGTAIMDWMEPERVRSAASLPWLQPVLERMCMPIKLNVCHVCHVCHVVPVGESLTSMFISV